MARSIERAEPRDALVRICEEWVHTGLMTRADRAGVADLLRELPPETLLRSVSDACAWRVLGFPSDSPGRHTGSFQAPACEPVRFSVFEEFLAPEELNALLDYALSNCDRFQNSRVLSETNEGITHDSYRRSRVLFDVGKIQGLIADRMHTYFNRILDSLAHRPFAISSVEAQITASNDGHFFRAHNDNTYGPVVAREITYVLFFHREPKAFTGGELRLYDSWLRDGRYVAGGSGTSIVPRQNMLILFPSHLVHEVMTVRCPSGEFADSRFTLNGWIHR